jgi:hypothetical protein
MKKPSFNLGYHTGHLYDELVFRSIRTFDLAHKKVYNK